MPKTRTHKLLTIYTSGTKRSHSKCVGGGKYEGKFDISVSDVLPLPKKKTFKSYQTTRMSHNLQAFIYAPFYPVSHSFNADGPNLSWHWIFRQNIYIFTHSHTHTISITLAELLTIAQIQVKMHTAVTKTCILSTVPSSSHFFLLLPLLPVKSSKRRLTFSCHASSKTVCISDGVFLRLPTHRFVCQFRVLNPSSPCVYSTDFLAEHMFDCLYVYCVHYTGFVGFFIVHMHCEKIYTMWCRCAWDIWSIWIPSWVSM